MLAKDGLRTVKLSCRFGDPETQVILPLLESDLYEIVEACCNSQLNNIELEWEDGKSAVGVVLAVKEYETTGNVISGKKKQRCI